MSDYPDLRFKELLDDDDRLAQIRRRRMAVFVRFVRSNPHLEADDPVIVRAFDAYMMISPAEPVHQQEPGGQRDDA